MRHFRRRYLPDAEPAVCRVGVVDAVSQAGHEWQLASVRQLGRFQKLLDLEVPRRVFTDPVGNRRDPNLAVEHPAELHQLVDETRRGVQVDGGRDDRDDAGLGPAQKLRHWTAVGSRRCVQDNDVGAARDLRAFLQAFDSGDFRTAFGTRIQPIQGAELGIVVHQRHLAALYRIVRREVGGKGGLSRTAFGIHH